MLANYGYKDGSGEYYITIDTDKCNGCSKCIGVCPTDPKVLEMIVNDYDEEVVAVSDVQRQKIKYSCAPCKPVNGPKPPCVQVCEPGAMTHSW